MGAFTSWIPVALGLIALVAFVLAVLAVSRLRGVKTPFSLEERDEWSRTPMTGLQKLAWLGLLAAVLECGVILTLFIQNGGAEGYWNNDTVRLRIIGIYVVGLVLHSVLMAAASKRADERDREIIRIAPQFQATALIFGLAAWQVYLGERFHEQGATPMVYHYLSFGSLLFLYTSSWFLGVLVGARFHRIHG